MINRVIKIVLVLLLLALDVYEWYAGNIGNGILIIPLIGLVVLFWFKHEVNLLAFLQIRRNKFESAKKILSWVNKPEELNKSQEAYYYFLNGLIESQGKNMSGSDKYFRKALKAGLNMGHDIAMANLNLASVAMARRRKREAMNYLTQVKKHDKSKLLNEQVRMLKEQMGKI